MIYSDMNNQITRTGSLAEEIHQMIYSNMNNEEKYGVLEVPRNIEMNNASMAHNIKTISQDRARDKFHE